MKKSTLSAAIAATLMLAATGAQAVTFNFGNSTTAGVQGTDFNYTCNTANMNAGKEFRMCDPTGALGGGLPAKKDTINGTEQWMFSGGTTGLMTGVANTATTGGINATVASYVDGGYINPSIDRNGGAGIDQGANFFGASFGFLAPTVGSDATTVGASNANDIATAPGVFTATSATTFTVFFQKLEAQWSGTHFGMGEANNAGITFQGTTDGTNFSMWAEELIDASEDYGSAGFAGWTAEWYYVGTLTGFQPPAAVPVPAAVWLFGSGLLGLVGVARRKKATV